MAVHFQVDDPDGIRIDCLLENWEEHVRRHPEIEGHETWAQETIRAPLAIYQSDIVANRHTFYRPYDFGSPVGRAYMRVIVAYNIVDASGHVTGALVSAHSANKPKDNEVLIWPVD